MNSCIPPEFGEARWIGQGKSVLADWRRPTLPAPIFRRDFRWEEPIREAKLYVCGLGLFECRLNGGRVGDAVLTPNESVYDRRWRYCVFDVGGLLRRGGNVLAFMLGNGMYNCQTADVWHFDKAVWRDYPKLLCSLWIDGEIRVVSDPEFLCASGPVVFDSWRGGEIYDARLERPCGSPEDLCEPEIWHPARIVPGPGGVGEPDFLPPCRVTARWEMRTENGSLYHAPYNLAGWARLRCRGTAGSRVTLRFGEESLPDGAGIDFSRIGRYIPDGTFQTDVYILKGGGEEIWEPRFTYHGFSMVSVQCEGDVTVLGLEACEIRQDFPRIGSIACSDGRLTLLNEMAERSIAGNSIHIPTDCPHREKNGWSSEAQLQCESALYFSDCADFYNAYAETLGDVQRPNGQLPGIAPTSGWGYNWGNGPVYDSALFNIPYFTWLHTGRAETMSRLFPHMIRYCEYCRTLEWDGFIVQGLGDWCVPPECRPADPEMVRTAYYIALLDRLERIGAVLGREKECEPYLARRAWLRERYNDRFYRGGGVYEEGGSTALALPLLFDLAPESERAAVAARLAEHIREREGAVDYGTVGSRVVPQALLKYGYADELLLLLRRDAYPGYGYWHREFQATTFWESWSEKMEVLSRNHAAFTNFASCFYRDFAGLRHDWRKPGGNHLRVEPCFAETLADFRAEYRGYVSGWNRAEDGAVEYSLTVPDSCTAELRLPGHAPRLCRTGTHSFRLARQSR